MKIGDVSANARLAFYAIMIILGLLFFVYNHLPLFKMMGLTIAVVCGLALICEPFLRALDRKRQKRGLTQLHSDLDQDQG